jgi:ribonuclease BN (tRNA processing enzyme)
VGLAHGVDLLIYDTQFTAEEYRIRPHWGHSTPADAVEIALAAQAKTLALFHHAPERTDDQEDALLAETRELVKGTPLQIIAAREQMEVVLGED